jgi:hypothetical protein
MWRRGLWESFSIASSVIWREIRAADWSLGLAPAQTHLWGAVGYCVCVYVCMSVLFILGLLPADFESRKVWFLFRYVLPSRTINRLIYFRKCFPVLRGAKLFVADVKCTTANVRASVCVHLLMCRWAGDLQHSAFPFLVSFLLSLFCATLNHSSGQNSLPSQPHQGALQAKPDKSLPKATSSTAGPAH